MEKSVVIDEIGNAYRIQLQVWKDDSAQDHGKPVVVLDTASDKELGEAVRGLFRSRIRVKKEKKSGEAAAA
ncbi:MAG: hypothetical protein M0Z38_05880 [Deltaproteobacteria bacterium]|nr:hypothetical protein [Deltaproteobacteria bacterium]